MFGLEGHKKKKPTAEMLFDLEKELKDPQKYKELQQRVEEHMKKVNDTLRAGSSNEEEFERLGSLALGYQSLLKVMTRIIKPKTKSGA